MIIPEVSTGDAKILGRTVILDVLNTDARILCRTVILEVLSDDMSWIDTRQDTTHEGGLRTVQWRTIIQMKSQTHKNHECHVLTQKYKQEQHMNTIRT